MIRIDFDHGEIGFFVDPAYLAAKSFARDQTDGNAAGAFDDVIVGENVALRIDDESAADAMRRPWRLAAKHIIKRITAIALVFVVAFGQLRRHRIDIDDGRLDAPRDFDERS